MKESKWWIVKATLIQLSPTAQLKNPVMFVVYLGALFASYYAFVEPFHGNFSWFNIQIAIWLWITVLIANSASAIAQSRGRAQAACLRNMQKQTTARIMKEGKERDKIPAADLKKGDIVLCEAGDIIPADGEVIEGIASVDESAITGESAPVIRESGGDRSAVTAGTQVVSDRLIIQITSAPGESFLDHIIHLIEGAKRQKTPNEIALTIVLSSLTLIFLLTVFSLNFFSDYSAREAHQNLAELVSLPILISLLVCLIPTTIGSLLNAIGIAGMNRMIKRNVIAKSGHSIETAGDIDLLLLDKTGTITLGNRMAVAFIPCVAIEETQLARLCQIASLSDETPEGRSIVILAKDRFGIRGESISGGNYKFITFSAHSRMSGVDFLDNSGAVVRSLRKGAVSAIRSYVESLGGFFPPQLNFLIEPITKQGGTPLLISDGKEIIGIIHLKDVIKGGIKEKIADLRQMGIHTIMITGDNPKTAAAISAEAGVDDFIAEASPEMKLQCILQQQKEGHLVGMIGDGTNDAPALAAADIGVAMNTGTQASREAGNMVDLDSNPTKLIDIVEIGKQLLITRGTLTTFSIANDVAKYFAIIPAMFGTLYSQTPSGPLSFFNVMKLSTAQSAILSAVIFNALIIIALIPLALRGVKTTSQSAQALLKRNVLIYGLGGLLVPFIGIKLIDLIITTLGLV